MASSESEVDSDTNRVVYNEGEFRTFLRARITFLSEELMSVSLRSMSARAAAPHLGSDGRLREPMSSQFNY